MRSMALSLRLLTAAAVLFVAACDEAYQPLSPDAPAAAMGADQASEALIAAMALDRTVFGGQNEAGVLVIGVEDDGVASGVRTVMDRFGIAPSGYRIEVTEPIHFAATLRDRHRPTMGGIQIHFSNFLCTLGFNVDHDGGRSFITNSHCTDQQGSIDGTEYFQPTSTVDATVIGIEVDDPAYTRGGECSRGKVCRHSDAARALYQGTTASNADIARTLGGVNSGDLNVDGAFDITGEDDVSTSFDGIVNKVGRTTGWTDGTVTDTCVRVNVSGSNIQLLCQTIVQNDFQIVGGGDSGSPVFTTDGTNAQLIGILWGGNSSGTLFVFSPLASIEAELGPMVATIDRDGTTNGDTGGGDDGGDDECVPNPAGRGC